MQKMFGNKASKPPLNAGRSTCFGSFTHGAVVAALSFFCVSPLFSAEKAISQANGPAADTLYNVRTAYYNVLQAEPEIAVREASVTLLSQELTNTIQRFETGTAPRFDVLRGEVEVAPQTDSPPGGK